MDLHLCFIQGELRQADSCLGIVIQSWALLGGSVPRAAGPSAMKDPLKHPTVIRLAAEYRWHIDHGLRLSRSPFSRNASWRISTISISQRPETM